ncbi:MAG TPA: prepilin-type N-terminal cleavage/methylation domain-containing protein [Desulfobacteria bacterium]|nr:prepilin-type N-terminal cleavage/methylation domain-containing protein [Desulfobacteria bacterium]
MTGKQKGFTLVEVLAAMTIMLIVVGSAVQMLGWQTRLMTQTRRQVDTLQSVRAAGTLIEREIRAAKSVSAPNPGTLQIVQNDDEIVYFYVADKDYNGVKDVYRETKNVPAPIASFIDNVNFSQVSAGEWEVTIFANENGVENTWQMIVAKRAE